MDYVPGAKIPGEEDDVYDNDFEDGDGGENGDYDEEDHDDYYDGDEEIMQGTDQSHMKSAKLSDFMTPLTFSHLAISSGFLVPSLCRRH